MNEPFEGDRWKDAITLSGVWSGAPGRSGAVLLAIVERNGVTGIWQWDDEIYTSPELVSSYQGEYDVRRVSRAVSEIEEGGICACEVDDIAVDGETGWRADLLAVAWWRDGEWECTASPLTSILLTLTDDELPSLAGKIGSLRNRDLLAVAGRIGKLRPGADSALRLIEEGFAALSDCDPDHREDVLEDIEGKAERWIEHERQRKLSRFAGRYELALELKERELLSEAGCRQDLCLRVSRFRGDLEDSIYTDEKLSPEAERVIADEDRIKAIPSNKLNDGFSREELEGFTEFDPPHSAQTRARILRAWGACDDLPSRFGAAAPRSFSSSNTFRFLEWLIGDQAETILSALKAIDEESAGATVERILEIASHDAKRLSDPGGFSGSYAGMGRSIASSRVRQAEAIGIAAEGCGIQFDHRLSVRVRDE